MGIHCLKSLALCVRDLPTWKSPQVLISFCGRPKWLGLPTGRLDLVAHNPTVSWQCYGHHFVLRFRVAKFEQQVGLQMPDHTCGGVSNLLKMVELLAMLWCSYIIMKSAVFHYKGPLSQLEPGIFPRRFFQGESQYGPEVVRAALSLWLQDSLLLVL